MKLFTEKNILSIPPTLYLVCLFLIPAVMMLCISFRIPAAYGGVEPLITKINNHMSFNLTLDNFIFVLSSGFIWRLIVKSLLFSIITTVMCLIIGYPIALLIASSQKRYRNTLLLLVIVPFWSNFLVRIYAWMIILGPNSGLITLINTIVSAMGIQVSVSLLYSSLSVIICLVYINLPFMILPLYANLEKHDYLLIDACRDLGASRFQAFMKITIPLSLPGIIAGTALVFIPCIGMFVVPELIGNTCSFMIGNLIKQQFLQTMNWPLGTATAVIITFVVISVFYFVGRFSYGRQLQQQ